MTADGWDEIVGIGLDDWMRADTPEQIEWLVWLRDHPLPVPTQPPCSCPQIKILTFGGGPVHTVPGYPDPECQRHSR